MVDNACSCEKCAGACEHKPGWFKPEQIAPLAEALGLTEQQLFDGHLQVDWFEGGIESDLDDIFVLSPAVVGGHVGGMFGGDPRGACRWLKDGRCEIHELGKPFECAAYHHTDDDISHRHEEVARAWEKPEEQERIKALLGSEPQTSTFYNPLFGGLFG